MAKFRFRLAALLRLRELEEERAKRRFHEIDGRYRGKQGEIDELVRQREEAKRQCGSAAERTGELDIDTLLRQRRYINILYQRVVARGQDLRTIGADLEKARRELALASQRRKVVEKIRERRRHEFELEEERRERRDADEISQAYSQYGDGPLGGGRELTESSDAADATN